MRQHNVMGRAGAGLDDSSSWAANQDVARFGSRGEKQTAEVINRAIKGTDIVAIHDITVPIPGFSTNIDHLLIKGNRVVLIDSKNWAPAFYWTVGGRTYRGLKRFKVKGRQHKWAYPAESKSMPMAQQAIDRYLNNQGVKHSMERPLIVVWSSSQRADTNVRLLKMHGSKIITGNGLAKFVNKFAGRKQPVANQQIVNALAELMVTQVKPARKSKKSNQPSLLVDLPDF